MKKRYVLLLANVIMLFAISLGVTINVRVVQEKNQRKSVDAFENMSVTMERVVMNFLENEQKLCNQWANRIGFEKLSMEEAVEFIDTCLDENVTTIGNIIYLDDESYSGLSNVSSIYIEGDYSVSYWGMNLFPKELMENTSLKTFILCMTRTFSNPQNGIKSLAFCHQVTLYENGLPRDAMVMRIVPLSSISDKLFFPRGDYREGELAIIDNSGNFIIPCDSIKEGNLFNYLVSYGGYRISDLDSFTQAAELNSGSIMVRDYAGQKVCLSYVPLYRNRNWILLGYIKTAALNYAYIEWSLVLLIIVCLTVVLGIDVTYFVILNKRLEKSTKTAQAASQAKTEFLSTMSHDIRTPMNAIIGMTTIASRNIEDSQQVRESLKKINLASNHLLTLVNDILDISKIESGSIHLSPVNFSLEEVAENLVNIVQPSVKEKNLDFSFNTNCIEYEMLFADQLRINQVFINLLSNAVKYTKPGGRVRVMLTERLNLNNSENVIITYVVEDNGIGMTREFMQKMYDPFSREMDSRVNAIQGTGLGLTITRKIVDLMGGTIECTSHEGKGTKFTVTLEIPVAKKTLEHVTLPAFDMLLVDDDIDFLYYGLDILKSMGISAESAHTGKNAVEMAAERHKNGNDYKMIIIDWKMPDMNGISLVRELRKRLGDDIPILIVSAYDWTDIEEEARPAGVNGFIGKPLFKSSLHNKINEVLSLDSSPSSEGKEERHYDGVKILIAEDNDLNWEIISTMLSFSGIETERAENGSIVLEKLFHQGNHYDMVFMDIQMPEMNGLEATRRIRQCSDSSIKNIPVVAMTADAFSENITACLEAGMNSHISKPVDLKQVYKEIDRLLKL